MSQKIAIIGAGILGLSTAYKATQEKLSITIFEKQPFPPKNASAIAGGMLAPFSEIETLPDNFIEAGLKSIDTWIKILGKDHVQITGNLLLAHQEDQYMLERFAEHLPDSNNDWKWVDENHIRKLEPSINTHFKHGLHLPRETHIDVQTTLSHLEKNIRKHGGEIIQKDVEPENLANQFDWVIDCRGYDKNIDPDLRGIKGEIITLQNPEFSLNRSIRLMHPRYPLYIIPRPNNVFVIGASTIENADEKDGLVFLRSAMELMSAAYSLHPSFGEAKVLNMTSAIRPAYPDHLPRIIINKPKRLIRCNGLFRHGYLLSPIMAESVAHYLKTGKKNKDFALFSNKNATT